MARPADGLGQAVNERKEANIAKMAPRLMKNTAPMDFHSALGALRTVIKEHPDAILVNEGANTLDISRAASSTCISRANASMSVRGASWVSAWAMPSPLRSKPASRCLRSKATALLGFSGMEVETICRYNLPVCVVVFNNNGIYRGTDVNPGGGPEVATTVFVKDACYDKLMEAFGGVGVRVATPDELSRAVNDAMNSGKPTLVNAVIDPAAGSESGNIGKLNPAKRGPQEITE